LFPLLFNIDPIKFLTSLSAERPVRFADCQKIFPFNCFTEKEYTPNNSTRLQHWFQYRAPHIIIRLGLGLELEPLKKTYYDLPAFLTFKQAKLLGLKMKGKKSCTHIYTPRQIYRRNQDNEDANWRGGFEACAIF
jgi:hypothetical protein